MTELMRCENITKEYGDKIILNNLNFKIELGEKVGIVGENGAGKTTLINIISGESKVTEGKIIWYKKGVKIGYLKQATEYEELKETLSGGEKTKKLLTEILYQQNNLLILDEPTNHLDYSGVEWLLREIKKFKGTVIIISHDRYFLDKSVNKIIEIEKGMAVSYNGNYSSYRLKKKKEYEDTLHQFIEQEKVKERINNQIEELKKWSNKAHKEAAEKARETGNKKGGKQFNRAKAKRMDQKVKSQIKRLQKIDVEGVQKPQEESQIVFKMNNTHKVGSVIIKANEIEKKFGKEVLFNKSSFYIKCGEKVGVYGPNGCGKSTLIKCILGLENINGELYISEKRKVGYISQEVTDLKEEQSILELFKVNNRQELGELRSELYLMGFDSDSLTKRVSVLSLGERMKLKLLLMIREECEMLILDEPTNHIDIHVREQLEDMLQKYNGTIVLVTHDRYMLEKICDKLLVFESKQIKRCEYGFKEYLEKKNSLSNKENKKAYKEEKLILDNKLAYIIGSLSNLNKESTEYKELSAEYNEIIKLKRIYS